MWTWGKSEKKNSTGKEQLDMKDKELNMYKFELVREGKYVYAVCCFAGEWP